MEGARAEELDALVHKPGAQARICTCRSHPGKGPLVPSVPTAAFLLAAPPHSPLGDTHRAR